MEIHPQQETNSTIPATCDFEILNPETCELYKWSVQRLVSNLKSMVHCLLIAPRGYGKQQIVTYVTTKIMNEDLFYRACHLDLSGIRSQIEFIHAFQEIFQQLFLEFMPLTVKRHTLNGIDDVLYLPEFIAIRFRIKLIVTMGNLQFLFKFDPTLTLLKKMSTIWKECKHCVFCLYGNQEQVERDLLKSRRRIIFGFVKIVKLPQPDIESMISGVTNQFRIRGKSIEEFAARSAINTCRHNPYYTRLLTWHAFLFTERRCTTREIDNALIQLIDHYQIHFRQKAESLTIPQLNFLKAYLKEWTRLCSQEDLKKFALQSSAHVARIKTSLCRKEILYVLNGEIYLRDPLFCQWLKRDYFR